MKLDEENKTHDWMTIHNDKIKWLHYDKKSLYISMKIIKIYDKILDKW